jgi:hypothetical protein
MTFSIVTYFQCSTFPQTLSPYINIIQCLDNSKLQDIKKDRTEMSNNDDHKGKRKRNTLNDKNNNVYPILWIRKNNNVGTARECEIK